MFKLAFVIFPGHTQPTFWSSVTYMLPDWESGVLTGPGLGCPRPLRRLYNPEPCLLPLQVLRTFSPKKDRAPAQALLPVFALSLPFPIVLESASSARQAFVLRAQALFPSSAPFARFQCRLAGPLPCSLAQPTTPASAAVH